MLLLRRQGEEGSVLPLLIGLLGLIAFLCGGLVNLSAVYLSHRSLYQLADSAALSAVTSLDVDRYYISGARALVPTSNHEAIINRVVASSGLSRVELESLHVDAAGVGVTLKQRVDLPWPLLIDSVVIRAHTRALAAAEAEQVP